VLRQGCGAEVQSKACSRSPSKLLYADTRQRDIKARSEGWGERRFALSEEKKRAHREQMTRKGTLAEVSRPSRGRQVLR
jgi:hypothetical protein